MRKHIRHMHTAFWLAAYSVVINSVVASAASDANSSTFNQPGQSPTQPVQSSQATSANGSPVNSRMLQAQISHSDAMSRSELSAASAAEQASLMPQLPSMSAGARPNLLQGAAQNGMTGFQGSSMHAQFGNQNLQGAAQNGSYNLQASAAQPGSYNLQAGSAQNGAFNLQAAAKNLEAQSDMAADVRKVEYNVDWASWLAKVADRWFFILDQFEKRTGQHYVTVRPALFRFTCYNNGQIANVTMKQSSGNATYDQLQMVALMQSMPVPQFPIGTRRQTITLVQGWESHVRQQGESDYVPGSFGRGFPMEKVTEWAQTR